MPTTPTRLTRRHQTAAMYDAQGLTPSEIAKSVGVSPQAIHAWRQSEQYRELVEEYRRRYVDTAEGIIMEAIPRLAKHLTDLAVNSESEHVQLGAVKDALDRAGLRRPSKADETGITLRIRIDD